MAGGTELAQAGRRCVDVRDLEDEPRDPLAVGFDSGAPGPGPPPGVGPAGGEEDETGAAGRRRPSFFSNSAAAVDASRLRATTARSASPANGPAPTDPV